MYSGTDEYDLLDNRLVYAEDPQMQLQLQNLEQEELKEPDLDPVLNLYYPMATADPLPDPRVAGPASWSGSAAGSSAGSLFSQASSSYYDMDFYTAVPGSGPVSGSISGSISGSVSGLGPGLGHRLGNAGGYRDERGGALGYEAGLEAAADSGAGGAVSRDRDIARFGFRVATGHGMGIGPGAGADDDDDDDEDAEDDDDDDEADGRLEAEHDDDDEDGSDGLPHLPRQRRFSSRTPSSNTLSSSAAGGGSGGSAAAAAAGAAGSKKVSDSRLSAQGLAEVLNLDSAEEALRRERFILDIFERELHYPLGYKTWVRDTSKDYRTRLLDELHQRVARTYPEYDKPLLETIIRRATYYMMQSRLRRERRAKAKIKRDQERKRDPKRRGSASRAAKIGMPRYNGTAGTAGTAFML
ncbi:LAMI_0E09054g1_1 [Lachancea mirantina]|uniref:LAMI_0E09054g1_1 n=1 Tax=Lachancea mirantina TaxID=1230905 RepID=A0A1G4JNA4_9SACH|nr:LAMI_0E09054g1_1 [Lachancea mirantina]